MVCFGQNSIDSLSRYSYRQLDDLIHKHKRDSSQVILYVNYCLNRAKQEDNSKELVHFYMNYVFYQKESKRLKFIDKALNIAHSSNDNELIGDAYLWKATVYHSTKNYQKTLEYYLKANEYLSQTDNIYSRYQLKNFIGSLKNYLGYYDDAAELFTECVAYFGGKLGSYNTQRGYVSSLQGLSWSYTKTNRTVESNELLSKALQSAKKTGFSEIDTHYPVFKQGINDYLLGRYDSAIYRIELKLPFILENEDFAWATKGEFYIGKAYWDKCDKEKAITYFKKVDEVFNSKNYTHPDLREAYELLINYYKERDDKDSQIKYIEQLVKVDSFYNQNHKYLVNRIHKEYTTKDLIQTKRELETALYAQKNRTLLITIVGIFLFLLGFGLMWYQNKKAKKTAQELIKKIKKIQEEQEIMKEQPPLDIEPAPSLQLEDETKVIEVPESSPGLSIGQPAVQQTIHEMDKSVLHLNQEVIDKILHRLSQFEVKEKFKTPNLTMDKLANMLGTNTTYLSFVVNQHKKQSFSEYINGLRIDYIVNEMVKDSNSVLFKFSFDALAKQVGFSSATVFSRTFKTHTGVTPSVFIKELTNNHKANSL